MNFGKSIRLFLIEGDPNGRWNSYDRQELTHTGIYFLFGKKDSDGTNQVYIGEAENVFERLNQHLSNKEFWTELNASYFISIDDNLNKAHIQYLENRIHSLAKDANRYQLVNMNTPMLSSLSEADCVVMEEFIENAKFLMSVLGNKVLVPAISSHSNEEETYFSSA